MRGSGFKSLILGRCHRGFFFRSTICPLSLSRNSRERSCGIPSTRDLERSLSQMERTNIARFGVGGARPRGFTHFPDKKPVERNTAISYAKALREYKPVPGTWSLVLEITSPLCRTLFHPGDTGARLCVRDKDEFRNPPQRPAGTTKSR